MHKHPDYLTTVKYTMKNQIFRIFFLILLACTPLFLPYLKPMLPAYSKVSTAYEIFFLSPFLLFFLVAFLGLRLNQTRIFYSMILLVLIYISLHQVAASYIAPLNYKLLLHTLLLFNVCFFLFNFLFDESAFFGWLSFIRATAIAGIFLSAYLIIGSELVLVQKIISRQWLFSFADLENCRYHLAVPDFNVIFFTDQTGEGDLFLQDCTRFVFYHAAAGF